MKATILHDSLNKSLGVVSRVVASRGQLPVLSNVLIEAVKEGVILSTTNLELGMRVFAGGKVEEEGAITVPARNLSEFVNSLPAGNIELLEQNGKLSLEAGKFSGSFAGIGASEFPVMPKLTKQEVVKIKRDVIASVAGQVAIAAATDESRPVLTGILVKLSDKGLELIATDGFRLSKKTIDGSELKQGKEILDGLIIPARSLIELAKIVGDGKKEEVDMEIVKANNQVVFGYDRTEMISRMLEGNFPDVTKIIPGEWKTQAIVDREELLRAVRAVAIFARDSSNIIKLTVETGLMSVAAQSSQSGDSKVDMEAVVEGDEGTIAFNYRYLLDYLSSIGGERIVFKMSGSLAPGVFEMETDKSLTHLVMPVRV